jgi:hypothetical protein
MASFAFNTKLAVMLLGVTANLKLFRGPLLTVLSAQGVDMANRVVRFFITLSLFLPLPFSKSIHPQLENQLNPGFKLVSSNLEGVVLDYTSPEYQLEDLTLNGSQYQHFSFQDSEFTAEPGKPQVPQFSTLIGVPQGARLELRILQDDVEPLQGHFTLPPAPRPAPLTEDLQPGKEIYEADPAAYESQSLYPSTPAHLGGEAWARDQRIVPVVINPLQYTPALGTLTWHRHLRLEVRFLSDSANNSPLLAPGGSGSQNAADPFDSVFQQTLLNYDSARFWRESPNQQRGGANLAPAIEAPQATAAQYKIGVDHDGLYRLTYANLQAAGMDVANLDPATFHMTCQGQDMAIYVENNDGDPHKFSSSEAVLFYGQKFRGDRMAQLYASEDDSWLSYSTQMTNGLNTIWSPHLNAAMFEKYTDENVYWLSVGGTPGPRMGTVDGTPGIAPTPSSYRTTVHAEQSRIWKTTLFTSEDTWFWDRLQPNISIPSITKTYTTTLSAPATGVYSATLRGEVVAAAYNDSQNPALYPDHHTRVYLNDPGHTQPVVDETWDGHSRYHFEAQLPQSQIVDGVNQLDFNALNTTYMISDDIYFDWFEIDYNRLFQAEADQIAFPGDQADPSKYVITGFTGSLTDQDVGVVDITQPLTPTLVISFTQTSGTLGFQVAQSSGEQFFAGKYQDVPAANITLFTPPDFSQPADYLIITHHDFITATQALANYRSQQGLSTQIVNVADLYDAFNYGIYNPIAIKNYLRYAFANWSKPPTYVVLVGDGHWNFKGYPNYDDPPIYMPPNLAWVDPWQGEVDSANLLATVVGNDPIPDVYISRMPVNSVQELDRVISKTIAYEATPVQEWQRHFLFVADNTPDLAGDFPAISDGVIRDYLDGTGFVPDRVYLDSFTDTGTCGTPQYPRQCPAATTAILKDLNQTGALLVNYVGHASLNLWANEQIFVNSDISSLTNGAKLPVVLSMTCLDGYWSYPNLETGVKSGQGLAEELLRADQRGAVATFSPTGLGVSTGHDSLQRGFYDELFKNKDWNIAPASQSAKLKLYATGSNFDLLDTFTIFGDPALHLLSPYGISAPGTVEAAGLLGSVVTYTLSISNTGSVTDTFDLSVTASGWPLTAPTTLGTLPAGSISVVPVGVQIPGSTAPGVTDTAVLTLKSRNDPTKTAAITLKTTSLWQIYLPVTVRK